MAKAAETTSSGRSSSSSGDWTTETSPMASSDGEHSDNPEQIYYEPYGPHKRIGMSLLLPANLQASSVLQLKRSWQACGSNDVLVVISPGLMLNFGILNLLLSIVEDPLTSTLAQMGELDVAASFSARLLGSVAADNPQKLFHECERRCFFTTMPPWLLPIRSFHKVVVFIADPRYTVLREVLLWSSMRRSHGVEEKVEALEFLNTYLQRDSAHLSGEELLRMAQWARQEAKEPGRVKLMFTSDFIADADAAIRDLTCFLEVQQPEVAKLAGDKLMAIKVRGLFCRCTNKPESAQVRSLVSEFEDLLSKLPADIQAVWHHNASLWTEAPNRRMALLGLTLHRHEHELGVSPERLFLSAHDVGACKPCFFFFKKNSPCQRGDGCEFCHDPQHAGMSKRQGKKERFRRQRQAARRECLGIRMPSPAGFSG
eukprot:TRINITY_DN6975_c0_g2_i1.p1 TRINITY_DN6975_c0_g2~~TRINITY_DN6975_c0_g2_i1.p1  ORF type:complete len:428 (+),score=76.49 TRINITY_DN6975_c0_g2_i1:94-1377(+)